MKKYLSLFAFLFITFVIASAQVGIGTTTPNSTAMLDVNSTTKGLLIPRLTLVQRNAIASPANGLIIYQTTNTPGIYVNNGTPASPVWQPVSGSGGNANITGTPSRIAKFSSPTSLGNSNLVDSSIGLLYNRTSTIHNNYFKGGFKAHDNAASTNYFSWEGTGGNGLFGGETFFVVTDSNLYLPKGIMFSSTQNWARSPSPSYDSMGTVAFYPPYQMTLGSYKEPKFRIYSNDGRVVVSNDQNFLSKPAQFNVLSDYGTAGLFTSSTNGDIDSGVVHVEYVGTDAVDKVGVLGKSTPTQHKGIGVKGIGGYIGVDGYVYDARSTYSMGVRGTSINYADFGYGVYGEAGTSFANKGTKIGVYGKATGGQTNFGGYFVGDVQVTEDFQTLGGGFFGAGLAINGNFSATGTKNFKIDHPTDPENKYLYHHCMESNEVLNTYSGNITTDDKGFASIQLPAYFEALNKDFRYQLTVIGTFAQAIVKDKITANKFVIQTNQPNIEVSWQVTGVRNDKYMQAHPAETEVDKEAENKGKYLRPVEWNQPAAKRIGPSDEPLKMEHSQTK